MHDRSRVRVRLRLPATLLSKGDELILPQRVMSQLPPGAKVVYHSNYRDAMSSALTVEHPMTGEPTNVRCQGEIFDLWRMVNQGEGVKNVEPDDSLALSASILGGSALLEAIRNEEREKLLNLARATALALRLENQPGAQAVIRAMEGEVEATDENEVPT